MLQKELHLSKKGIEQTSLLTQAYEQAWWGKCCCYAGRYWSGEVICYALIAMISLKEGELFKHQKSYYSTHVCNVFMGEEHYHSRATVRNTGQRTELLLFYGAPINRRTFTYIVSVSGDKMAAKSSEFSPQKPAVKADHLSNNQNYFCSN